MMELPVESHHAPGVAAAAQMLSNVNLLAALPGSLTLVLPADPSLAHLMLHGSSAGQPASKRQLVTSCELRMSAAL